MPFAATLLANCCKPHGIVKKLCIKDKSYENGAKITKQKCVSNLNSRCKPLQGQKCVNLFLLFGTDSHNIHGLYP